jgi:hypothetical protein
MPDKAGFEANFLPYLRAWVANLVLASVDYGVSLSCGDIGLLGALYFNAPSSHWWFLGGAALPLGPLGLLATSKRAFRAELELFRDLHEKNLITAAEYDAQRTRVLAARADRLYGTTPVLDADTKPAPTRQIPKQAGDPQGPPEAKPKKAPKAARAGSKLEGEVPPSEPSPTTE